jgi:DNA repair exonuclease SbcCD ATPase subunit
MDYEIKKQLETKDNLIKLKDEQVKTLENSLQLKDEQINTLEKTLKTKDDETKTLEKTITLKEEEIKKLTSSAVDSTSLKEKDKTINQLQKEIEILNGELAKADEELEGLELENEKLRNAQLSSKDIKIMDFTDIEITKSEILEKMREMLENAISSVSIVVPSIEDLQELYLYEIRSSVNMMIACSVNPGLDEHSELLDEFESLDNISLRNYERRDRYVLSRDGEELLFAAIGKSENNNLVIHTKDPKHIKLFSSLATEGWIQSRKI